MCTRGVHGGTSRGSRGVRSSPSGDGVVLFAAWVVLIPKSFHPLKELEVILESTFHETIDGDALVDFMGFECLLEDFEVLNVLILICRVELR